jgi:capsid protein
MRLQQLVFQIECAPYHHHASPPSGLDREFPKVSARVHSLDLCALMQVVAASIEVVTRTPLAAKRLEMQTKQSRSLKKRRKEEKVGGCFLDGLCRCMWYYVLLCTWAFFFFNPPPEVANTL